MASTTNCSWLPLESNPTVFQEYTERLEGPSDVLFTDLFALEDWAFEMLPKPVLALLLICPLTPQLLRRYREGGVEALDPTETPLWFTKQTIPNACGTIALLHTLMNLPPNDDVEAEKGKYGFPADGALAKMKNELADCAPEERATKMETDTILESAHQAMERKGDTEAPTTEEKIRVIEHFVALVRKDGRLYELDGRLNGPVDHGSTSPDTFLTDAKQVIQSIMKWDPEAVNFSIIAVCEKNNAPPS